jgi:hypothetical protein
MNYVSNGLLRFDIQRFLCYDKEEALYLAGGSSIKPLSEYSFLAKSVMFILGHASACNKNSVAAC